MKSPQAYSQPNAPKWALKLLNQIFEIEKKLSANEKSDPSNCLRQIARIKESLEDEGLFYQDPTGQQYNETRSDLEATISGQGTENLIVVEVIKPIIRIGNREFSKVSQKGIVIVESQPLEHK